MCGPFHFISTHAVDEIFLRSLASKVISEKQLVFYDQKSEDHVGTLLFFWGGERNLDLCCLQGGGKYKIDCGFSGIK